MAEKYTLAGELVAEYILCARHDAPVMDSIFGETVSVFAFQRMELEAETVLLPLKKRGLKRLVIYVTGCQSALVAVLNVCTKLGIRDVFLKHHDRVLGGYQEQRVLTYNDVYHSV